MKLETQVVSLELSKELREKGYEQSGLWWWSNYGFDDCEEKTEWHKYDKPMINHRPFYFAHPEIYIHKHEQPPKDFWECVAPTVAELGERLPERTTKPRYEYFDLRIYKHNNTWRVGYVHLKEGSLCEHFKADILANVMAKMWLYLKNQKLL